MRRILIILPILAGAVAGAAVALAIGGGNSGKTVTETIMSGSSAPVASAVPASSAASGGGMSVNQIYKQDSPGVVDITVTSESSGSSSLGGSNGGTFGYGYNQPQTSEDEGAGVVYDTKGDILTDEHVVSGQDAKVEVHFQDGTNAPAKILGSDPSTDVAVIKVDVSKSELHPIPFADSSTAQVGDSVVAIGSPFSLPETVTQGIVSAVGRTIQAPNNYSINGAIQTDAAINPGNSGGPLLDGSGHVLGLNDQIQTSSGDSAGIGFATPGNTDVQVAQQIIGGQQVKHAYVGVCVQNTTSGTGAQIATSSGEGCQSSPVVAGSPAAKAGLQPGDVILSVNGRKVTGSDDFTAIVSSYAPGQTIKLQVKGPGGGMRTIKVTLGNRPATAPTQG